MAQTPLNWSKKCLLSKNPLRQSLCLCRLRRYWIQSYENVCREDILMSLEYYDLSSRQALAQLKSRTPLENVFEKWDGWKESHHMVNIWNATEARAIEVVRANFIEARRDAR